MRRHRCRLVAGEQDGAATFVVAIESTEDGAVTPEYNVVVTRGADVGQRRRSWHDAARLNAVAGERLGKETAATAAAPAAVVVLDVAQVVVDAIWQLGVVGAGREASQVLLLLLGAAARCQSLPTECADEQGVLLAAAAATTTTTSV